MPPKPLILFAASEIYPFSKTGGLADVMGALPLTLHRMGVNTALITPLYGRLSTAGVPLHLLLTDCPVGYPWPPNTADIYLADFHGMPVYFVHREEYFDRRYYYNNYKGDYFDNCERFIFFSRATLEFTKHLETIPAVLHVHDWQAALIPAYLKFWSMVDPYWKNTKSVLTIHNLAFQGRFSSRLFWDSGLPKAAWNMDGVEYFGDFGLLKGGISYADKITTVSPSYAREVLTPEFGCGLEGILSKRSADLSGILNGADYEVWDPADDRYLPFTYTPGQIKGKMRCKDNLIQELGLDPALVDKPLLGFIGRLRRQKGIDLLIEILPELMKEEIGLIILGEGNQIYEEASLALMEDNLGRMVSRVGYTEDLAHRILAGSDIFLMPSRYEPCGLTQIYALRYGALPVATAVGGLKDTITPYPARDSTGFTFDRPNPGQFLQAVRLALSIWKQPEVWRKIRKRAMMTNFSWEKAAEGYIQVYRDLGVRL